MSTLEADVAGLAPAWSGAGRWKRIRHFVGSHPLFVIGLTVFLVIAVASLSFIGIGAQPPDIEWGLMAAAERAKCLDFPWTVLCPGLAIFVTVLAVNLVGDGIRDLLDPKHQEFK